MSAAGRLADPEEVRAHLLAAATAGQPITYSELLHQLGHEFTRPKMRALCKVLGAVDQAGAERGEPELAVLVVRQSDGLPGQGWWVDGGAASHGYTAWGKGRRRRLVERSAREGFAIGRTEASVRAWPSSAPSRSREPRHSLDRWSQASLPEVSFNIVSRGRAPGSAPRRQAANPGTDRVGAADPNRRPSEPAPRATAARRPEPLTAEEAELVPSSNFSDRTPLFFQNRPACAHGGPRPISTSTGCSTACRTRGAPKVVPRLDKGTSGALLSRRARAAGRSQGFCRRTRARSIGAWWSAFPRREGLIDVPLAKHPAPGAQDHVTKEAGPARQDLMADHRPRRTAPRGSIFSRCGRTHQLRAHMRRSAIRCRRCEYGGPDAFLTGGIAQAALAARRIRIDTPQRRDRRHRRASAAFAETIAGRWLRAMSANAACSHADPAKSPEIKERRAAAAAKARRRERKGERRSRGGSGKPARGSPSRGRR